MPERPTFSISKVKEFILLFILTANGVLPGGSGNTIRIQQTNNTHRTK
jgi:hypothetical protein